MGDLLTIYCEKYGHLPKDIDPTGGDPAMGGPVAITVCDRCGKELPHSQTAIAFNNKIAYEEEAKRSYQILRCEHYMNNRQVPCPPECPRQSWPKSKFRRTLFTRRWKLKT